MVQITNITDARKNLSSIVKAVSQTKQPVIVVRDSLPSVVIQPYSPTTHKDLYLDKLENMNTDWFTADTKRDYKKLRKELHERDNT